MMNVLRKTMLAAALGGCCALAAAGGQTPAPDSEGGPAWLGVFLGDAVDGGVHLVAIVPGGPAARAGLRVGDVVVQAGDARLTRVEDLTGLLERAEPGVALELHLLRSGRELIREVRLTERPTSAVLVNTITPRAPAPPPAPAPPRPVVLSGCRAYGLALAEVTPDLRRHYGAPAEAGVLVTGIDPGRPAWGAGIRVGDVLVRIDGQPVRRVADVEVALRAARERALPASLIREREPRVLTLQALTDAPTPDHGPSDAAVTREALDRALRSEIERLEQRVRELKRQLERIDDEPERP